jgi:hypothetical protein
MVRANKEEDFGKECTMPYWNHFSGVLKLLSMTCGLHHSWAHMSVRVVPLQLIMHTMAYLGFVFSFLRRPIVLINLKILSKSDLFSTNLQTIGGAMAPTSPSPLATPLNA